MNHTTTQGDSAELENFKILRSIWKNTYDKILEIKVINRRSWNESKKNILEEEKKKINSKYDKEYSEQFIANKIQISEARNSSNLNKMRKRNELIEKLSKDALDKIISFADPSNEKYRNLVRSLILQGMVKLLEPVVYICLRKKDADFVKNFTKDLESEYSNLMREQTGDEYKCVLEIDSEYLDNESGGVLIKSKDKKITLINDLESRLRLAYEQHLPVVKGMLFPTKTTITAKAAKNGHTGH